MPELPEVETYTRYFARHALAQTIKRVDVRDPRILGDTRPDAFVRRLKGRRFTSVRRHGKHLFADAKGTWLHLHFGMTGDLLYYRDEPPRFARVVFEFTNGAKLAYDDMRLFGVVDLLDDPDAYIADHRLGRDPLDPSFKVRDFLALLEKRRGAIKAQLMSQELVAGLGNLYVDELLYQTSIHPTRSIDRITEAQQRAMFTTMRKILRDVIGRHERDADHPARYLINHRETGERCPMCGGTIRKAVVAGRTTYFCGTHQK
ncbi:MAG TPA: DNA-formamidopyrimidine glycosylase family protein [Thermoanaerobaculia bacterium]